MTVFPILAIAILALALAPTEQSTQLSFGDMFSDLLWALVEEFGSPSIRRDEHHSPLLDSAFSSVFLVTSVYSYNCVRATFEISMIEAVQDETGKASHVSTAL